VTLSAGRAASFLSSPVPRLPSSSRRRAAASSIGLPLRLRGTPPRRAVPVQGAPARNAEAVRAARNVGGSVPGRCRCACRAEHGCQCAAPAANAASAPPTAAPAP